MDSGPIGLDPWFGTREGVEANLAAYYSKAEVLAALKGVKVFDSIDEDEVAYYRRVVIGTATNLLMTYLMSRIIRRGRNKEIDKRLVGHGLITAQPKRRFLRKS